MKKLTIRYSSPGVAIRSNSMALIFLFEGKDLSSELKATEKSFNISFTKLQQKELLDEKVKEYKVYIKEKPDVLLFAKINKEKKFDADFFRNTLSKIVKEINADEISNLYILLPEFEKIKEHFSNEEYYYQTVVEGLYLGNYDFDKYKSDKKRSKTLNVFISNNKKTLVQKAIKTGTSISEAVYFTRDLVNEPAITLTPEEFARRAKQTLSKEDVKVTVYTKKELIKRKMNALLAVGEASTHPACLIEMHYKPRGAKKKIALVGKGVTYDSGGLSIKPTEGMIDMNTDMAGGGTVMGTIYAAAKLKLPVEILGLVPAVENMIAGNAYKPGDVVKTASGKSIEVKNTDAEGRVILADALEYAMKAKPEVTIDLATLTGACVVALGEYAAGLFTKDDTLAEALTASGYKTYERVWRLPMWDEFGELLKSDIADVSNLGPRWGGAITAAKFLENFITEKSVWAHIDIAGPASKNKLNNYTKDFHTGFGVRLLTEYLRNI